MMNNRSFGSGGASQHVRRHLMLGAAALITLLALATTANAHNVTPGDAGYIQEIYGVHIISFIYLGAKHMMTGYDHILFLLGVVFFLYYMKDVAIYVSLFAVGHSITMLLGVWYGWGINAYLIDAIIGFSVVYKALDNLGYYQKWLGFQPNTKAATLVFGLFHGTGLASKILEYRIAEDGLLANLIAFNVGVEVGQILALAVILIVMGYWRRSPNFMRQATVANIVMVFLGVLLIGQQLAGFFGHGHT
ncbi:MAG: HupE/UreJ family protein [Minwuia sp.]|nr:HupE/UreJ family protein [Minwuia sp.]